MLLREAHKLVHSERNDDYGNPYILYQRIALAFSAVLGIEVDYQKAILCMEAVKLVRESTNSRKDNRIDGAGYWEVLDWAIRTEQKIEAGKREVSEMSGSNGDSVVVESENYDDLHCV